MSVRFEKESASFALSSDYEINTVTLNTPEPEHTHQFIELVYTLSGTGVHTIDDKAYPVKGGDMLWINYRSRHAVTPIEGLRYVDIMLKPAYVNRALRGTEDVFLLLQLPDFSDLSGQIDRENVRLHFEGEERKKIEKLLEWTKDEQGNRAAGTPLMLHAALLMLLCMMFRKMAENPHVRPALNDWLLDYMARNCHTHLSMADLAEKCGYTAEHFSRLFRKYTGKTPSAYIHECRIRKAKRLLRESDQSIEEIIAACGYSDRSAFFKRFSDAAGMTPLQYRKNQK